MRDRVAAGVLLERQPRLDVEHVERLRGERTLDRVPAARLAQPQPGLVRRAAPGRSRLTAAASASPSPTTPWPSTPGKRRTVSTTRTVTRSPAIWSGAAFVGRGGQPRRGEDGNRIRGLARPDPRRDRVRERVPDARPVDPGSADADPVADPARHVRKLDGHRACQPGAGVRAALDQARVRLDRDPRQPAAASRGSGSPSGTRTNRCVGVSISAKSRPGRR